MEKVRTIDERGQIIHFVEFNGKRYSFSNTTKRYRSVGKGYTQLAKDIWEYYNGKAPGKFICCFKDGDTTNLDIENIQMLSCKDSRAKYIKKREDLEYQTFNGETFYRYKNERYFSKGTGRLHKSVWGFYNGDVPKGYEVHHKDFDSANNDISNLICITKEEHREMHKEISRKFGRSEKQLKHLGRIRDKTKEWHSSEAGRKWHSEHGKRIAEKREEKPFICEICGKHYTSKQYATRFCSNNCKSKYRRLAGLDNEERICGECGAKFTTNKYGRVQFCCLRCAGRYTSRKRNKG